ncbi:MAG TPA: class I SAM-dependent methyltransferase, partial [Acidobacteriota bacterium]|nr:class I SAM-dependent methyltransferase [Acidobacteriota bacterium]
MTKRDINVPKRTWARFSPGRVLYAFSRLNFRRMEECATIIRWLDARRGEHILDIGCGDGAYDKKISRSGAAVQGIDIHEKRLSAARKYCQGDRTAFHDMDASRLEFPDASFDKAMSLCVVEHLEDDELVMRNVARALKPGGLFVFSADSLSTPGITPDERARHQRKYAVKTFYTVDIVRDKLARAGFDIVETRYILSTATDLKFIRLSWKLDRIPGFLRFLRLPGYAALG